MSIKSFGAVLVSCLFETAKAKPEPEEKKEGEETPEVKPEEEKKEEQPGFPQKMFQKRFGQKKK